jgi:hypothetical protein
MAIDTFKGTEPAENTLRTAMSRAGEAASGVVNRMKSLATAADEPLELTEIVDDRRLLNRVAVKTEVLSYVSSVFRQRTSTDGTILAVSYEQLVQELTDLVLGLDSKAQGSYAPPVPTKKQHHTHGEPAR